MSALKRIKKITSEKLGIVFDRTQPKSRAVTDARKIACLVMRSKGYSLAIIGNILGIDHSTVLHHLKSGKDLLQTDRTFAEKHRAVLSEVETLNVDWILQGAYL